MTERDVAVTNSLGLHARPAAELVKLASTFSSEIWIAKGELDVNAKSIMGVLTLAAEQGAVLRVRADGDDEERAVAALFDLIRGGFGKE